MPILIASTRTSANRVSIWRAMKSGSDRKHPRDRARVLGGERRDHGAGVGAERAERLDVREHAGPAGRVDAGDRQHGWNRLHDVFSVTK
jgi:hypothetical protein